MDEEYISNRHLYQHFADSSRKPADNLSSKHFSQRIQLRLPDSHGERDKRADDIDRSAAIFQSEGSEEDTANCKASTVGSEGVIQLLVGYAELFYIERPNHRTDIETSKPLVRHEIG